MMIEVDRERRAERIKAAAAAAAFHALLGYALLMGLGVTMPGRTNDALKLFDVRAAPPPPPVEEPVPAPARSEAAEGAASPPNLVARPSPVVAPVPEVRLDPPPPIVAAPAPAEGSDPSAGASTIEGPGSGSGGEGDGTGSGRTGSGRGGGGIAERAALLSGRISDGDYPRSASRARAVGTVIARVTVGPDGRPSACAVIRSSGNTDLDATTCRLIEQRFRYRPAKDRDGRPVPDVTGWKQVWWLERGRRRDDVHPVGADAEPAAAPQLPGD